MKNRLFSLPLLFLLTLFTAPLSAQEVHACVVMPSPTSTQGNFAPTPRLPGGVVQRAVALGRPSQTGGRNNFWANGSTVRVRFLGGSAHVRRQVVRYAREWAKYANLNFAFVDSGPSDIRVSFVRNGSSWSMLGRQASYAPANQATMNFGWFTDRTADAEFRRTVLHEFGHALGLLHEHQNPEGGIPWNEAAVYDFYRRSQGWDQRTTYQNVIARRDHNETQYSAYDAASIMHYPVSPRLTRGNYAVGLNTSLSITDVRFISGIYPGRKFTSPASTNNRPGTTTRAPSRPEQPTTTTVTRPSRPTATREVNITNRLGQGQRAEKVELYLNRRKYVFQLREGERSAQTISLNLRPGTYDYLVKTASVYTGMRRVWDGRRYVERRQNHTVQGAGSGKLHVKGDQALTFYGKYDKRTGRFRVYLGELGK